MKPLREVDKKIRDHWYILALDKEVKEKPIRRIAYDKAYVVFRDEKGNLRAAEDKCIHRGTQLSKGVVKDGCIRCPYHGWLYDSKGRLIEVPSQGRDLQKAQKSWKLKSPFQSLQDDCLWIWCGDSEPKTNTPPWKFPYLDDSKWKKYFMITDFENEVTNLVQNFMDVPHTVFVHKNWFRKQESIKVPISLEVSESRVKVTYHQRGDSIGFFSRMFNANKEPMEHTDEFIFPNITRVDYTFGNHGFLINSQCTPISRYKTRVYTWIAYNLGFMGKVLVKPLMAKYTKTIINQDVDIMLNQGTNLRNLEKNGEGIEFRANFGYKSTAADELHIAIDRLRSKGASGVEGSPTPSIKYTKESEFWI